MNAPSSQVKSGMIGALSQIYLGSFSPGMERHAQRVHTLSQSSKVRVVVPCSIRSDTPDNPVRLLRRKPRRSRDCPTAEIADARPADECPDAACAGSIGSKRTCNSVLSSMPDSGKRWVSCGGVLCPSQICKPSCGRARAIVEYVMDEKGSYAIEINRAGLKIHNLPARARNRQALPIIRYGDSKRYRFPIQRERTLQATDCATSAAKTFPR